MDMTLRVEVKRWLIGFGANARVLVPSELRDEIEKECGRLFGSRRTRKAAVRPKEGVK